MLVLTDERCLGYRQAGHPERPLRVKATNALLLDRHPDWSWVSFAQADEVSLLRAHSEAHLRRLQTPSDFDADTAFHEGIYDLARLATGAALTAMTCALQGDKAFVLMRPPGHHAERERAMGFCYINHVAVCALEALSRGVKRVAVWDFDAHHGNGTEAILSGVAETLYVSSHQSPCYPGTGDRSHGNCCNYPVAPLAPAAQHMAALERSWREVLDFEPELVLVSAGFDAYEHDPITQMSLRMNDFQALGERVAASGLPTAALLEGGYSDDLPELVDAFLVGWTQ